MIIHKKWEKLVKHIIGRVSWNRDKKFLRSKFQNAVLEKWIFENFREPFYDYVIFRNDSNLWSNEELRNWNWRPEVHVGGILKLDGYKMSRKFLKLNGTPGSPPTACGLRISRMSVVIG